MSLDQPTNEKLQKPEILKAKNAIDSFISGNKHDDELKSFDHEA